MCRGILSQIYNATSAPIGAWGGVILEIMTERPTNQPTDQPKRDLQAHGDVSLITNY